MKTNKGKNTKCSSEEWQQGNGYKKLLCSYHTEVKHTQKRGTSNRTKFSAILNGGC